MDIDGQSVSLSGLKKYTNDAIEVAKIILEYTNHFLEKETGEERKKAILIYRTNRIVSRAYTGLLVQDDKKEIKKRLKEWDSWIKDHYPKMYRYNYSVKRIKAMRMTGFMFTGLYQRIVK